MTSRKKNQASASRPLPTLITSLISTSMLVCGITFGQSPPNTDIFLVHLAQAGASIQMSSPVNITNHNGYDNQPSFTPDGKAILYTAMRETNQTDIYQFDIKSHQTTQLTSTPESEYSPTVTPDHSYFSVIRVEADKTQRLWKFPFSNTQKPELLLPAIKPVGYHCWLNNDWLALFILGKPNSLQLAQISTGDTIRIEGNIGRALQMVPGQNAVSFVHKQTPTNWIIKQLNLDTRKITDIIKALDGSEDFIWTPTGSLLMGHGSMLYQFQPGITADWKQLVDYSSSGIKQLSRLAIDPSGKLLALVGQ